MRETERVIIACYLLAEGLDGRSIAGFLDALEQGVAAGETDALRMREEFRKRPVAGVPPGDLGDVVTSMKLLDDLQDCEARLERMSGELGLLQTLTAARHPHGLAVRVAARRISDIVCQTASVG